MEEGIIERFATKYTASMPSSMRRDQENSVRHEAGQWIMAHVLGNGPNTIEVEQVRRLLENGKIQYEITVELANNL